MPESPPPTGLGPAGRARWKQFTADLEFQPHELIILEEACRVVDVLARIRRRRPSPKNDTEIRLQQEQLRKAPRRDQLARRRGEHLDLGSHDGKSEMARCVVSSR